MMQNHKQLLINREDPQTIADVFKKINADLTTIWDDEGKKITNEFAEFANGKIIVLKSDVVDRGRKHAASNGLYGFMEAAAKYPHLHEEIVRFIDTVGIDNVGGECEEGADHLLIAAFFALAFEDVAYLEKFGNFMGTIDIAHLENAETLEVIFAALVKKYRDNPAIVPFVAKMLFFNTSNSEEFFDEYAAKVKLKAKVKKDLAVKEAFFRTLMNSAVRHEHLLDFYAEVIADKLHDIFGVDVSKHIIENYLVDYSPNDSAVSLETLDEFIKASKTEANKKAPTLEEIDKALILEKQKIEDETFKVQIASELKKMSTEQIVFFDWLCAVRILPFIGIDGNFDYWKQTDRMNHLYALFMALDISVVPQAVRTMASARARAAALNAETAAGKAAAEAAARASGAYDKAPNKNYYAVNLAHEVCNDARAAAEAAKALSVAYNLQEILIDDVGKIQDNIQISHNDTSLYGKIWENFQQALEKEDCAYWGCLYKDIFDNSFILDKEAHQRRLNVPKEIHRHGAAAAAAFLMDMELKK
jgi:hypothetical protein